MNRVVKSALIFVCGAGIGGAAAWFVTKKKYEKEMDERISAEIEETKKWYEELAEKTEKDIRREWEMDEEEDENSETTVSEPEEQYVDLNRAKKLVDKVLSEKRSPAYETYTDRMNQRKEALLRPERMRYDKISTNRSKESEEPPDKDDEQKEVDEVLLKQNDDNPNLKIYVITAEQFAERNSYEKVDLYWWELERILSEEDMSILDVPDILGYGWEAKIGAEERDVVYVRNENLETDFNVEVKHESFYEMRD